MPLASLAVCGYVAALVAPPRFGSAAVVCLALASVLALAFDRPPSRRDAHLGPAVACFAVSWALSSLGSVDVARTLALSVPLAPGVLVFLLTREYFAARDVHALYATFTAVSLALAGYLLTIATARAGGDPMQWVSAANATLFVVPNDVMFFATTLPLSLALILPPASPPVAIFGGIAAVADIAVIIVYQSRGALLVALLVTVVWSMRIRWRWRAAGLLAMVVAAAAIDAACGFPLAMRFSERWFARLPVWWTAVEMFRDAPLLGQGPRAFGVLFEPYVSTLTIPEWVRADPRAPAWAHNLYLETLAEQGVVGLVALLGLLVVSFRAATALCRADSYDTRRMAAGAAVALIAIAASATFELSFVRLWVVVLFFSIVGSVGALE